MATVQQVCALVDADSTSPGVLAFALSFAGGAVLASLADTSAGVRGRLSAGLPDVISGRRPTEWSFRERVAGGRQDATGGESLRLAFAPVSSTRSGPR